MKRIVFMVVILAVISASCNNKKLKEDDHHTEEVKIQLTAYSNEFELFAEADPFVVGKTSGVLSHFSHLPGFSALEKGRVTIRLIVDDTEVSQSLGEPTRKGIYKFDLKPKTKGVGRLVFDFEIDNNQYQLEVPNITVYTDESEANEAAAKEVISSTNAVSFTKEQSWKIDFATSLPSLEPFGHVIKTTALVQSAQGNEVVISAKTNGIVLFNSGVLLEGSDVVAGQSLCAISGGNFADNNISVRYAGAKSNYDKANTDYERAKELAKDKIVSEKDLLSAKNQYENAKAVYDNLSKNFNASGQTITSPQAGFIKQVFVKNGSYVEAGQPLAVVSQNKSLVLKAEVPLKYAPVLANIKTANIKTAGDNRSFSLEQLNGKVLSYGKAANSDNYLIPISLQVENNGSFVSGSFVEVYLKSFSTNLALVIPTTALLEEQGIYFVWVQIHPELFEKREVFVGGTDGIYTEIKSGIAAKERVVVRGAMLIKLAQATGALDAHSGHVH